MATAPHFHWPTLSSAGGVSDSDVAGFGFGAPEMAPPAADTTALVVSPDQRAVAGRPRTRRHSSGKHYEKGGGGGAKKPPQRGLGVAELERLRCGGDPLRELAGAVGGDTPVHHPLMHCNHLHHHHHAPAFDARYCPPLLVPPSPAPAAPGCGYVHHHPAAATCGHRAPPALAPEQQYFMDRWGHRMGPGFTPASNGAGGGDHHAQSMLAPEHPSSQSTIWRPAASSCLEAGHRCDLCARRTVRTFAERGASLPPPSALPPASSPTAATVPDYSIYDLAAAMATARQGGETAFQLVRGDRKRGALMDEAPDKKEVREIEFFPAASTHHGGGGGIDESEFVPPVSSSSYFDAGSRAAPEPHLDLSLRL